MFFSFDMKTCWQQFLGTKSLHVFVNTLNRIFIFMKGSVFFDRCYKILRLIENRCFIEVWSTVWNSICIYTDDSCPGNSCPRCQLLWRQKYPGRSYSWWVVSTCCTRSTSGMRRLFRW